MTLRKSSVGCFGMSYSKGSIFPEVNTSSVTEGTTSKRAPLVLCVPHEGKVGFWILNNAVAVSLWQHKLTPFSRKHQGTNPGASEVISRTT